MIVALSREARKSLQRVTDLISARTGEFMGLDEAGEAVFEKRKLTDEERIQRVQSALTHLQKAEDLVRQLRASIERALEKEWKSL